MKKQRLAYFFALCATLLSFLTYLMVWIDAWRPPLFGIFETIITIVLVINLLSGIYDYHYYKKYDPNHSILRSNLSPISWGVSLAFLGLLGFFPKTLNPDFYLYDVVSVVVFFHFRMIAAALFTFATIVLWRDLFSQDSKYQQLSKNFLLVGTVVFLISELSGSWWCQNGWGDSWHWSKGFLKAAALFMAVMLACHLPPLWSTSRRLRTGVGTIPAVVTLWVIFLH